MHFVLCSKQGNKIEGIVLDRVCILGMFCPIQGRGFKPLVAPTQILVKYPAGLWDGTGGFHTTATDPQIDPEMILTLK